MLSWLRNPFNKPSPSPEKGRLSSLPPENTEAFISAHRYAATHIQLAEALEKNGKLDEAAVHLRNAIELDPASADAYGKLARIFLTRGDLENAETLARRSVAIDPSFAFGHNVLGVTLLATGLKNDEAMTEFRAAVTLDPELHTARFNLSQPEMLRGNYAEGFALYESRFEAHRQRQCLDELVSPQLQKIMASVATWQGEALTGQRLLIWEEQGHGDLLLMLRYLPLLLKQAPVSITVVCSPALASLVRSMSLAGTLEIIDHHAVALGDFDIHCSVMSLPHRFGIRLETIPHAIPYLTVSESARVKWRKRSANLDGFKVGLVWSGNPDNPIDAQRSVTLAQLAPLFSVAGVCFVSLQKNEGIASIAAQSRLPLQDWMQECSDFLDTAALIENLDLVIAVDTAVAHLAGALGKPVWMLNRLNTYWCWFQDREDSPWYPTMRIFRQTRGGEWDDVILKVAQALAQQVSG
jgi:tetratricopeptide (TPR) repeat protein